MFSLGKPGRRREGGGDEAGGRERERESERERDKVGMERQLGCPTRWQERGAMRQGTA